MAIRITRFRKNGRDGVRRLKELVFAYLRYEMPRSLMQTVTQKDASYAGSSFFYWPLSNMLGSV